LVSEPTKPIRRAIGQLEYSLHSWVAVLGAAREHAQVCSADLTYRVGVAAEHAESDVRMLACETSLITTRRTVGQLRGAVARIALAASQIVGSYERYGPEQPWGFADPTGWKCSARYCAH
jgi:hypothetical protein